MQSLASPRDLLDALLTADRSDQVSRAMEKIKRKLPPDPLEKFQQLTALEQLRPERAIMNLMDMNRNAEEDRNVDQQPRSAFDDILSAKVAAAVGPVYAGEGAPKPDLASKDPFTPASAIGKLRPKIDPKALSTLKAAGYPTEIFTQDDSDPLSMLADRLSSPDLKDASEKLRSAKALALLSRRGYY